MGADNLKKVKDTMKTIVSSFFAEGLTWDARSKHTRAGKPYVTLWYGNVRKKMQPISLTDPETGYGTKYWESTVTLSMDIYENGASTSTDGVLGGYENTALDDMLDLIKYLESDVILAETEAENIAVALKDGSVMDLSELENESQYRYRAHAEFEIRYTDEATGPYGQYGATAGNTSGGNKTEYTEAEPQFFDEIEIEMEEETE